MTYALRFTSNALEDLARFKKAGNKKVLQKILNLLEELKIHPKTGTGQPEKLKHELSGYYSRRKNMKHQLIYEIQDEIITVIIVSAYSHYDDR